MRLTDVRAQCLASEELLTDRVSSCVVLGWQMSWNVLVFKHYTFHKNLGTLIRFDPHRLHTSLSEPDSLQP